MKVGVGLGRGKRLGSKKKKKKKQKEKKKKQAKEVTTQGLEGTGNVETPKCEYCSGNINNIEGVVNISLVIPLKKSREIS